MAKKEDLTGVDRNLTQYGDEGFSKFIRRAFLASSGHDANDLRRPIVGIADTTSDFTTCHRDMPQIIEAVKRGVLEAGGLPLVFPTISLGEILINPTSMIYRNLLAMETEEMIAGQPMDAVVLLGGCDKTVPAQLMAAVSANLPAISVVTGPMLTGSWKGVRVGACTDCRGYWSKYRAGEVTEEEIAEIRESLCPTSGTCMVMGSASTMACLAEALGLMLPGGAAAPSGSGDRLRHGVAAGRRAAELAAAGGPAPMDILTMKSFRNALTTLIALGGSTNAIVHLAAIARRAGLEVTLDDLEKASKQTPLLVDCKPAGCGYLQDFHNAGGMPALLKALEPLLELDALRVDGQTLGEFLKDVQPPGDWQTTIHTLENPLGPPGSIIALRGSLAPNGAVLKKAAATEALLQKKGPAVVFESPEDVAARIDDPSLKITTGHIMILRNAGPVAAGMPEAGSFPIPKYLAEAGVKDMVRISDARMSGTAFGTVVLHCAPEAAVGGPLGLVQNGDIVELDAEERRLDLLVDEAELERRRQSFKAHKPPSRGWKKLYAERVLQADQGADLNFL